MLFGDELYSRCSTLPDFLASRAFFRITAIFRRPSRSVRSSETSIGRIRCFIRRWSCYAASHRAVAKLKEVGTLPRRVRIRSSKYLNNVVEQDHRRIKQRIRPMLGFKRFETATVTIRGIELAEKIKKNQFNIRPLTKKIVTAPELWSAVLAA